MERGRKMREKKGGVIDGRRVQKGEGKIRRTKGGCRNR